MKAVGRTGRAVLSTCFGLLVLFLYAPLIVLLVFAFNSGNIPSLPIKSFSTKWFSSAFSDTTLTSALLRSFLIAVVNELGATLLGVMAAVSLARRRLALRGLVVTLILIPLVVPYIVLAVGMVVLLHELGIATSLVAVLAGHVVLSLPYSVLVILPNVSGRGLGPRVRDLAGDQRARSDTRTARRAPGPSPMTVLPSQRAAATIRRPTSLISSSSAVVTRT